MLAIARFVDRIPADSGQISLLRPKYFIHFRSIECYKFCRLFCLGRIPSCGGFNGPAVTQKTRLASSSESKPPACIDSTQYEGPALVAKQIGYIKTRA